MIYVVRASGNYWKDINMVTTDKEMAIETCRELAKNDDDNYHQWCVTEHKNEDVVRPLGGTRGYDDVNYNEIFTTEKDKEKCE